MFGCINPDVLMSCVGRLLFLKKGPDLVGSDQPWLADASFERSCAWVVSPPLRVRPQPAQSTTGTQFCEAARWGRAREGDIPPDAPAPLQDGHPGVRAPACESGGAVRHSSVCHTRAEASGGPGLADTWSGVHCEAVAFCCFSAQRTGLCYSWPRGHTRHLEGRPGAWRKEAERTLADACGRRKVASQTSGRNTGLHLKESTGGNVPEMRRDRVVSKELTRERRSSRIRPARVGHRPALGLDRGDHACPHVCPCPAVSPEQQRQGRKGQGKESGGTSWGNRGGAR